MPILPILGIAILAVGVLLTIHVLNSATTSQDIRSHAAELSPTSTIQNHCQSSFRQFLATMGIPCDTTISVSIASPTPFPTITPQPTPIGTPLKTFNDLLH